MREAVIAKAMAIVLVALSVPIYSAQQAAPSAPSVPSDIFSIPAGHKFILELQTPLHTNGTKKGDKVEFRVAGDVVVADKILIPNRSIARGNIIKVKRAGRMGDRAELQLRFDEVQLNDGMVLPLRATITRVGFNPVDQKSGEDPKLKGDAGPGADAKAAASAGAQGAIIGVLTGGPKGAMYGAGIGAAAVLISSALKRGPDLDLPRGTMFEASFDKALEVPAATVMAQNAPGAPKLEKASDQDVAANTPDVSGRPRLKRSTPASDPTEAKQPEKVPDQDVAANEPEVRGRPQLKRPTTAPAPSESPIPEPETPVAAAPPAVPKIENSTDAKQAGELPGGGYNLSVKVNMVQVDAMVRDRSGRMIENLRLDDFRIYEDGVLQDITSFSQDELPIAVALVVDRSGSVGPYIAELRRIAARALDQLKKQDEVCLFSFAGDVQRMEELTTDRRRIAESLDRIRAGGSTDITDALYDAAKYLSNTAPDSRHVIILVSDNQQTVTPRVGEKETITTMLESDTVLFSLKTGASVQLAMQLPSLFMGDAMERIAKETGGEVVKVSKITSLDGALGTVISRLRTRYSLGYYPQNGNKGGAFHSITVRLSDNRGKPGSDYFIHSKRGYYSVGPRS
jgi:Ca-activated chloride channel homolog